MGDSRLDDYIGAWLAHASAGAAAGGPELQRLLSLMAADVRYEDVPFGAVFIGHQGIREMCAAAHAWSNDMTMTILSSQTDGHRFAIEVQSSGTTAGDGPTSGRAFSFRGASIGAFDSNGLVTEQRDHWDLASFLRQIGSDAPG